MSALIALASGLIFGLGLIASGMTDPAKIQNFLDLAGTWDPSLMLVMGGAIAVAVLGFTAARRRSRSWAGDAMELPDLHAIDRRLIGGGVLFGIGWGLTGFCPGPALVAASSGFGGALVFVLAMLVGMMLHDRLFTAVR